MDELTVGELKRHLSIYKDSDKISFSGGLSFYRLKRWGDDGLVVEFNEAQGELSDSFKKQNPQVKVIFIDSEDTNWNEEGTIGKVDVNIR